jgi:hypothetical protein
MTPAPATVAGRGTTASPGHRRRLQQRPAPRVPRRVSGPVAAPKGTTRRAARRRARSRALLGPLLGRRALALLRTLPDRALLDRLIRGRVWIPLLGVLLAGIVAMQVEVLKLGAGMGRSISRASELSSQNELLRASVASLADEQRIEGLAAAAGMVMPPPTAVGFLRASAGGDAGAAVANIHSPNPVAFESLIATNGALVTGADTAVGTAPSSSPSSTAPATTSAAPATAAAAAPATGAPQAQTTAGGGQGGAAPQGTGSGGSQATASGTSQATASGGTQTAYPAQQDQPSSGAAGVQPASSAPAGG